MKLGKNAVTRMLLCGAMVSAMASQSGTANAQQAAESKVSAIDILLEPDATMIQHATAANAELLKNFPKGYTLGGAPRATCHGTAAVCLHSGLG